MSENIYGLVPTRDTFYLERPCGRKQGELVRARGRIEQEHENTLVVVASNLTFYFVCILTNVTKGFCGKL